MLATESGVPMNAHFPDHETVYTALSLATRAPSVHNTQPWRWRVGSDSLHLYAEPELHLPSTDPDGRDLILSCGITLHHCVVALAALGWQAKVHRLPNPDEPKHLAAVEVYRHASNEVDITLAAAIPRRRTDRRHYSSWNVPSNYIALMGARAARAGVMLRQIESLPRLQHIVAQAVWRHATDHDYLTELTTWSGRYASLAGVPASCCRGQEVCAVLVQPAAHGGERGRAGLQGLLEPADRHGNDRVPRCQRGGLGRHPGAK